MKRVATWAFYAIGAIAIAYLALYAYVLLTGRDLQPGDPIRIFRKPGAPNYSAAHRIVLSGFHSGVDRLRLSACGSGDERSSLSSLCSKLPSQKESGQGKGRQAVSTKAR